MAERSNANTATNQDRDQNALLAPAAFVHYLGRTLAEANRFLMDALEAKGLKSLSPSHGDILQELFARNVISMQELAAAINRDPSTVTALVKKLNALGYTTTQKSTHDQRVTEVRLTEEGRAIQEEINGISEALQTTQMEGMSEEEVIAAMDVMERIRQNFLDANEARDQSAANP